MPSMYCCDVFFKPSAVLKSALASVPYPLFVTLSSLASLKCRGNGFDRHCLDFDFLKNSSQLVFALKVLTMFVPGKLQTLQTCLLLQNHFVNIIRGSCFLSLLEAIILKFLWFPCVLMCSVFEEKHFSMFLCFCVSYSQRKPLCQRHQR